MTQKQTQVNYVAVFEIPATVRIPLSVEAADQQSALVKGFDLVRELTAEKVTAYLSLMADHAINISLDRVQVEPQSTSEEESPANALVVNAVSSAQKAIGVSNEEVSSSDVTQAAAGEEPSTTTSGQTEAAVEADASSEPLVLPDGSVLNQKELIEPSGLASSAEDSQVSTSLPPSPLDAAGACFTLQLFKGLPSLGDKPFEEVPDQGFKAAEALALEAVKTDPKTGLSKAGFARVKDYLGYSSFEIKAERGGWEVEVLDASGNLAYRKSWMSKHEAKLELKQALRSQPFDFKFYLLNSSDREAGAVVVKKVL